ncbi:ketopantoate reductase family protein [Arcobacter aquimarinus]|uniref:2-dehydropantoate 2-reductase n=1 Tax=Arcobacter aquimarinus TaxID=1315211 RepID=A0AAE7B4T2_9BACT|nr:ketopantoate reductase family protein [Arcobacter aquimarinus]QKE25744.1 2-dehydropantoate 2-reductase [Arcobacter aquimarinus]RXI35975.1 ketopantoate reductase [Arcobacter aquimarinus]
MRFLILGAGGIGSYFGARLIDAGHDVIFVARGKQLEALQQKKLKLQHPEFSFFKRVVSYNIDEIKKIQLQNFDAVLIATKSTSTLSLANDLKEWFANKKQIPYIISLQNGVDNEEILSTHLDKTHIIAGLTRKIGAHIVSPAVITATGTAETILGAIEPTKSNESFLNELKEVFNDAKIPTQISENINVELWKKLIINNGVNAICALLKEKTGEIMHHEKLSKIVYGLMSETAIAALNKGINISKNEIDDMFDLITNFDSIKPSMLVDVENNRELELDEICTVVIKNCEAQGLDAPYTRTISTILEYVYYKK